MESLPSSAATRVAFGVKARRLLGARDTRGAGSCSFAQACPQRSAWQADIGESSKLPGTQPFYPF
jgi:hypothetical protein